MVPRSVRTGGAFYCGRRSHAACCGGQRSAPLLALQDVQIDYPQRHGKTTLRAVDGVSLQIARGETVGLVGESGCGKSTLSKAILRLVPTAGGEIRLRGTDLDAAGASA